MEKLDIIKETTKKVYCWYCNKITDFYEKEFTDKYEKYCSICNALLDTVYKEKQENRLSIYDSKKLGNNKCWYCGCVLYASTKTTDHFLPKSIGGRLRVICCANCNRMKGNLTPSEFIDFIKSLKKKYPDYQLWQKRFDRMIKATSTLWERVKWSI